MSFLNAAINNVEDEFVKEQFHDRVDIVRHKIKFMDKVTVTVLDASNQVNHHFDQLIDVAGGQVMENPAEARVVIYAAEGSSLLNLMGLVPALIEKEWPAVTYNRLYLMDAEAMTTVQVADAIDLLEDLAELLNPGTFVFGNEGKRWMSFGV